MPPKGGQHQHRNQAHNIKANTPMEANPLHGYHCSGLFLECAVSLQSMCYFLTLITKVVDMKRNKL